MKNIIIAASMALVAMQSAYSSEAVSDSLQVAGRGYVAGAAAGAMAIVAGSVGHDVQGEFGSVSRGLASVRSTPVADVAQFVPLALPWALKACGVPTRSGWGRMAVSQAFGGLLMTVATESVKRSVTSLRPDGSDWRSFPSGHTARAFFGATVAVIELGEESPWYAFGSYLFATGVGVSRVVEGRHFPADVVAGAGIGIVAAEAGYLLGDVVMGRRGLSRRFAVDYWQDASVVVSLRSGIRYDLGSVSRGDVTMRYMPAMTAALCADWYPGGSVAGWKLGLNGELATTYVVTAGCGEPEWRSELSANVSSLGLTVMPGYEWSLSDMIGIGVSAGGGCHYNLPARGDDSGMAVVERWSPVGRIETGVSVWLCGRLGCRGAVGYELSRRGGSAVSSVVASVAATVGF